MTHLLSETARAKHFRISSVWPWPRWRPVFFGIRETVHSTDASADVKSMNPKHSVKESGSVKTRKLLWSKYWKTAWCQTLPLKFRGSRLVILNQSPLTPALLFFSKSVVISLCLHHISVILKGNLGASPHLRVQVHYHQLICYFYNLL